MKKNLFLGVMAATMLFATSCQKEEDLVFSTGENAMVSFSVSTPEIATRAFSDGKTATRLQYAVYDSEGERLNDLTVTDGTIDISTTVNLQLTTGNTYSVIFWAAAENAPYTVNFDEKKMTVDYTNAVSNDENRDAFYKYHTFTVKGAQTETIELKRPFAQLNIGTSDYAASASAGYEPKYSTVTVPVSSELNFVDGSVNTAAAVEFMLAAIPDSTVEDFPVVGYEYMAMNYLLVPAAKEVVEVTFGYSEDSTAVEKTRTVGSVPVQRNYRTNIYGQLLTSDVDINVIIEPTYKEPAHEAEALFQAAAFGGTVTLEENVTLTNPIEVQANMVLDLNGKTISGNWHKDAGAVIKVAKGVTLKVVGGTISSTANNGGSAIQNNGTLVVEDATLNGAPNADGEWPSYTVNNTGNLTITNSEITSYHGAVATYGSEAVATFNNTNIDMSGIPGFTSHGIYVYNGGKVVVNGGNIANNAIDQNSSGGSVINGAVTVNSGTFTGRIENYYGTPVLNGGSYSVKPNAAYVAENKAIVEKDGRYYVVNEEIKSVATTATELNDALKAGENVLLAEDVEIATTTESNGYAATGINVKGGQVFDGNGNTLSVPGANTTWASAIATTGGTIKNVTINAGFRGIFMPGASADVYVDNVVIGGNGLVYTFNSDAGNKNYGVYISNSTLNGWTSFSNVHKEVVFTNCQFGEGSGYAFCRPYNATEFVNCAFEAGFEIDARAAITFENCTLDGVAITAANVAELVTSGTANATVK